MRVVEKQAKKIGDAIELALKELGATLDQVTVDILSNGGIFKNAKVKVTLKEGVQTSTTPKVVETPKVESKAFEPSQERDTQRKEPVVSGIEKPVQKSESMQALAKAESFDKVSTGPNVAKTDKFITKKSIGKFSYNPNERFAKGGTLAGFGGQLKEPGSHSKPKQVEPPQQNTQTHNPTLVAKKQAGNGSVDNEYKSAAHKNAVLQKNTATQKPIKQPNAKEPFVLSQEIEQKLREILRVKPQTPPVPHEVGDYIAGLLGQMQIQASVECFVEDKHLDIFLESTDDMLVGNRGEVLDSIELLATIYANRGDNDYIKVCVDTQDFRRKRLDVLAGVAKKTADKAVRMRRKLHLEPMGDLQRKIIHTVLQEDTRVVTHSDGVGLLRHVVVVPKKNGR
ncbi:MAG: Jag N-terminal domain-containing protein [Firmicutes bacterium]|nr:Jag N-terminal domain-containing protein [Bacillota bacterium]